MKTPKSRDGIPVFTKENFLRPEDNVYIHMSTDFPEYVGVLHSHEYIEIVYVLSGSAMHRVGDETVEAKKGDLFIINCGMPHAFYKKEDESEQFCAYDLMFSPDFFEVDLINGNDFSVLGSSYLFYSMFPEERTMGADLHLSGNGYNDLGELFQKIYMEYHGREKGYINIIRAYVIELIIKIFRRMDKATDKGTMRKEDIIKSALEYLKKNYNMHISVNDLASRAFLSRDYFSKLFRETTGKTVTAFLNELRIEEARRLLRETDYKIAVIAEYCGFGDMKYFYTVFNSRVGMTPGEYRKEKGL